MAKPVNPEAIDAYTLKRERDRIAELKAQLDKIMPTDLQEKYAAELEQAEQEQTTWYLHPLPGKLVDQLEDKYVRFEASSSNPDEKATSVSYSINAKNRDTVKFGRCPSVFCTAFAGR